MKQLPVEKEDAELAEKIANSTNSPRACKMMLAQREEMSRANASLFLQVMAGRNTRSGKSAREMRPSQPVASARDWMETLDQSRTHWRYVRRGVSTQSSGLCSNRESRWVPSTKAESNRAPKRGR